MAKKLVAIFAQGFAMLFGLYGLIPIVVAIRLAGNPWWVPAVVGLGGLSAIACGVMGFWLAGNWYQRLAKPVNSPTAESTAKKSEA